MEKILSFAVFQRVLQMDAVYHLCYIDEAEFILSKARRGRNIIGHRAIINVPGSMGVTSPFVLPFHRMEFTSVMPILALTTQITFSDVLHNLITANNQIHQIQHIVIWDVSMCHSTALL